MTHVIQADLDNPEHQAIVLSMVRAFARDPMGNGGDLSVESQEILIEGLRKHPTTLIFLSFDGDCPTGILVGFVGFSTFSARPLVNIHDFYVEPKYRRQGVGRLLLQAVEDKARALGCCRLTLEVQQNNRTAQSIYRGFGFEESRYDPEAGTVLLRQKKL